MYFIGIDQRIIMTNKNKKIELAKRIFHKTRIWLFGEIKDSFNITLFILKIFGFLTMCYFVTTMSLTTIFYFQPSILNGIAKVYNSFLIENYGCNPDLIQGNSFPKK
jgi:hypothetical protein